MSEWVCVCVRERAGGGQICVATVRSVISYAEKTWKPIKRIQNKLLHTRISGGIQHHWKETNKVGKKIYKKVLNKEGRKKVEIILGTKRRINVESLREEVLEFEDERNCKKRPINVAYVVDEVRKSLSRCILWDGLVLDRDKRRKVISRKCIHK